MDTTEELPAGIVDESQPGSKPTQSERSAEIESKEQEKKDGDEKELGEKERELWESERRKKPLKAEVAWRNFDRFKNRYSENDGLEIIEVLIGHTQLRLEVERELRIRESKKARKGKKGTAGRTDQLKAPGDLGWCQRIRIQSPDLLRLLCRLSPHGSGWPLNKPRVFFPPYTLLHYSLPDVIKCAELIEKALADDSGDRAEPSDTMPSDGLRLEPMEDHFSVRSDLPIDDDDNQSDDGALHEDTPIPPQRAIRSLCTPTALKHIRVYIDFVTNHLEKSWKNAAGTSKKKFRWYDLPLAFKPGELLYIPEESQAASKSKSRFSNMGQKVWRYYTCWITEKDDETPDDILPETKMASVDPSLFFNVYAYYLDWNGSSYVPVTYLFDIGAYPGEKDITSLDIFPLRFSKDPSKTLGALSTQGRQFQKAVQTKHMYHDGWSLTKGPMGESDHNPGLIDFVEGEVIIDFDEGYKRSENVGPGPAEWVQGLGDFYDDGWLDGSDNLVIKHWKSGETGPLKLVGEITERTQLSEFYCAMFAEETTRKRPVAKGFAEGRTITSIGDDDEDIVLLPNRVVAYSLKERRFFMLYVKNLKVMPRVDEVFNDLEIDSESKAMVRSLVKTHLEKQAAQRAHPGANMNQDLIRGKGSGLFLLLHGVPGVGKTATAEAVALTHNKPLFVITCGDLGFTPSEVEERLRHTFRLAHLWDCVLLLDEADVFLARREIGDLKRNALVSVFLRSLEYYNGILFLTTNRVGTLDEAFKSRIHVSLYYPPLDEKKTMAIYSVNIRKLRSIQESQRQTRNSEKGGQEQSPDFQIDEASIMAFAHEHFSQNQDTPTKRWNGRQIRNAFQIAHSLICYKAEENSSATGKNAAPRNVGKRGDNVLGRKQFEEVSKTIEKFDDYLLATHGKKTDLDRARKNEVRADDFNPNERGPGNGRVGRGQNQGYRGPIGGFQDRPSPRGGPSFQRNGSSYISGRNDSYSSPGAGGGGWHNSPGFPSQGHGTPSKGPRHGQGGFDDRRNDEYGEGYFDERDDCPSLYGQDDGRQGMRDDYQDRY